MNLADKRKATGGKPTAEKERVRKINVKPLMSIQRLNSNKDKSVSMPLTGGTSTEKGKVTSIHDLLDQLQVSPNSKEAKVGKMAAERWRQRSVREAYDDFCAETSFSALTRIHKASHMYKRILWLLACLTMLAWLTIQCVWLLQKYFSYPVEVKIERKADPNMQFPSITLCNINPLRASKLSGSFTCIKTSLELDDQDILYDDYINDMMASWESDNVTVNTSDDYFWRDYMSARSFNRWDALENDTEMEEKFYSEMDDAHVAMFAYSSIATTLTTDELKSYGHQKDDLIMSCTWKGLACSPANFTYVRNNLYGNCYTLNAFDNGKEPLSTNYAGPMMGLTLELNIEQSEYIAALSPDAGVKLVIHERGTYPVPEDEGLSIPPGYKTSIGLSKTEITRLPPPHADCGNGGVNVNNYYMEEFGVTYTKSTCLKSCFQATLMEMCDCASSFFYVPAGATVCGMNSSDCFDKAANAILNECNTRCPTPCSDTNYEYTISMSQWPSEPYSDHLDSKISKSHSDFMKGPGGSNSNSQDNLVKVEVYYKELMKETVQQQKAYESQNLISDIGGQLGLWLGLSAITFGEIIEFAASLIHISFNKMCRKTKRGRGKAEEAGLSQVSPLA